MYYFVHPESSCCWAEIGPITDEMFSDGNALEVDYEEWVKACKEWGYNPEEEKRKAGIA